MSVQQCRACGSSEVDTSEDSREIHATFGPNIRVLRTIGTCRECGESGAFFPESTMIASRLRLRNP